MVLVQQVVQPTDDVLELADDEDDDEADSDKTEVALMSPPTNVAGSTMCRTVLMLVFPFVLPFVLLVAVTATNGESSINESVFFSSSNANEVVE